MCHWQKYQSETYLLDSRVLITGKDEIMRILNNRISQMFIYVAMVLLASNVKALAQPPDNAALLYYQAFLQYEEPNQTIRWMLYDFCNGEIDSNEAIARHIKKNRYVIDRVVTAAGVSKCDWGYDYSQGNLDMTTTLPPLRSIALLLEAEARWLAEQGNYTTALDRCVTLCKIALHTCYKTLTWYLFGSQINRIANETTQDVLGLIPGDLDELNRLKSRLSQTEERFPSLVPYIIQEGQMWVAMMQKDKVQPLVDLFGDLYEGPLGSDLSKRMFERIRKGDDTFFERSRDYYLNAMSTVVGTLESGLPYTQICAKLDSLVEQWNQEAKDNPDAIFAALFFPPVKRTYQVMIKRQTHVNALKTAIDLYIVKTRTGQLPDTLPADSPTDLFSGKSFAYSKTAEAFVLRCQGKEDLKKDKVYEYEFKVK
jgi:hypothetical protein